MKVDKRVMDVDSNLGGEKVAMGIDQEALAHVMSVLTDLYSDTELACLREYSTNAFDSHIEAGQTRPIEVSLPGPLSPYLRIRDYGIGLDADDIRNIYSKYGTSTKRDSNDVVGMLGLGCKSALTYTNQFTVSGVKGGVCTQVSVSRDEDGAGSMTIVSEYVTSEPNGAEIIIPAKSGNQFETKANNFFRFWSTGTVFVNGEEPKKVDGLWVSPTILITNEVTRPMIVMGNVAYPMSGEVESKQKYTTVVGGITYNSVCFVDIGDIQFTPSRESLQMSSKTKAFVEQLNLDIAAAKKAKFEELIAAADTPWNAVLLHRQLAKYGYAGDEEYKGVKIPLTLQPILHEVEVKDRYSDKMIKQMVPETWWYCDCHFDTPTGHGRTYYDSRGVINDGGVGRLWFTGFDAKDFTAHKRLKLYLWLESKGLVGTAKTAFFVPALSEETKYWIDPAMIYDWAEVDAIKVTKDKTAKTLTGRPTGAYDVLKASKTAPAGSGTFTSEVMQADQIDTSKPLFWMHGSKRYASREEKLIITEFPDATIACLPENRIKKFERDFPMAVNTNEKIRMMGEEFKQSLTEDELIALSLDSLTKRFVTFTTDDFADPRVKKLVAVSRLNVSALQAKINKLGVVIKNTYENPLEDYPLVAGNTNISMMDEIAKTHTKIYMNAVYAARKEKV